MTKHYVRLATVVLMAIAASGCASSGSAKQVAANYDPNADFSAYDTYTFAESAGRMEGSMNSSSTALAIAAITRELLDRGLKPTNVGPDLKVDFYIGERSGVVTNNPRVAGPQAIQPHDGLIMWSAYDPGTAFSRQITEGVMMIVISNAQTKALLFEGRAEARVSEDMRDDLAGTINTVVARILDEMPD